MKTLPCSPTLRHQPVHDERRARHVAGVFQEPEEEKEDEDLRQEDDDAADAGDDAVHQQAAQVPLRQHRAADQVAEPALRPSSMTSIGRAAQVKIAWNITPSGGRKAKKPPDLVRHDRSIRSLQSPGSPPERRAVADALDPFIARLDRARMAVHVCGFQRAACRRTMSRLARRAVGDLLEVRRRWCASRALAPRSRHPRRAELVFHERSLKRVHTAEPAGCVTAGRRHRRGGNSVGGRWSRVQRIQSFAAAGDRRDDGDAQLAAPARRCRSPARRAEPRPPCSGRGSTGRPSSMTCEARYRFRHELLRPPPRHQLGRGRIHPSSTSRAISSSGERGLRL